MERLPSTLGLLAFDAVARHSSFSRAAKELHISQGAVSHRIRALEEELGMVLFVRSSRKVRLSDAGHILFRATEEGFGCLRRGLSELRAATNPHCITVSCSPSFAIRWLVPHLGALRRDLPKVELHINANDAIVEPGSAGIDLCIRFGAGGYTGVRSERLTRERVEAVCSPLYAAGQGLERGEDLGRCVLLHDDVLVDHPARVGWRDWLDAAGLPQVCEQGIHFSHSHLALDAATAGQGVALARHTLVRRELEAGRLVAPFDVELECGLCYWLIAPSGPQRSAATESFRDWLHRTLGDEADAE